MAKISALITVYNLEKYISGAIDSVLMQKGNFELEILVGDDGSDDKSVSIVKDYISRYPDKIRLFEMPRESGVNYNRVERSSLNRINLLENATGDYICFLDGDDFYTDEQKFEKQLSVLENDKTLSMCTHNVVLYYGEDTPLNKQLEGQTLSRAKKNHKWSFEEYWQLEFIQANAMLFRNYYNKGTDIFPLSIKQVLSESAALRNTFDDNNITVLFFMYGDMYYLKDVMAAYRQSQDSSWNGIDELKKHCSNMIGFSIENELMDKFGLTNLKNKKNVLLARHYKDFDYIGQHMDQLSVDNCQPFYDTAKKYNITFALSVYDLNEEHGKKDIFNGLIVRSGKHYKKARIKRIIKKLTGSY